MCRAYLGKASRYHNAEYSNRCNNQFAGNTDSILRMPLPMLISYRGEVGEPVACQVEMAVHTKALLNQLSIQLTIFINQSMLMS